MRTKAPVDPSRGHVRFVYVMSEPDAQSQGTALLEQLDEARAFSVLWNPDERRFQADVEPEHPLIARVTAALSAAGEMDGRRLASCSMLFSAAGCARQGWHRDFDVNREPNAVSVLFATEYDTHIDFPNVRVAVPVGWACLFDACVVHAGSAYTADNARLFLCLCERNETRCGKVWIQ